MSDSAGICDHVRTGSWPFRTELVFDEHLGVTDALMLCRHCGRAYLLEMLDWRGSERVMRLAPQDAEQARRLVRDLTRGSCDVSRAGAEVQHMRTATPFSRRLLMVDTKGPVIDAIATVPPDLRIPGASWRELPCDGSWVDYVQQSV